VRGTAAVTPVGPVGLNVEGVYQRHEGARVSKWVTGRAGFDLPLGLSVSGTARVGSWVSHPMVESSAATSRRDLGAIAAINRSRFGAEVGYWRTDGFAPMSFQTFRTIDSIGASEATKWITVSARVAPLQWFILDGWYSNPVGTRPEGVPPTHSIVNATLQSKFLPTFRSGIFGLKLQGTMESWGNGVIGRDKAGAPIALKGATFFRAFIQLQIGDFIAFYDRSNFQASRLGYVPGIEMLRLASTFGVRWEFSN
jgi:hypothetical protein